MDTRQFLQTVITADQPGYFVLAVSANGGRWLDMWLRWPQDLDEIVATAERHAEQANVYFSSYLFKAPQATKENVLPSRTIQADLDDASLSSLPKPATVLVETSSKRHQAYWILNEAVPLDEHESLSRKLTYSIELCDRSGWALGRKVRLPNTLNHKYLSGPHPVKVVDITGATYSSEEFALLPEVPGSLIEHYDVEFIENPSAFASEESPLELLESVHTILSVKVYNYFKLTQPDRSEALWSLMCGCFKAGLSRGEVYTVAKASVNNKFADFRHRADQDLAKDVLRAEHTVKTNLQNDRQVIEDLYRSGLSGIDRKRTILNVVLKALLEHGEFLRTEGDAAWYIRRDLGKPTAITLASEGLQVLLDLQFGLNSTEPESRYCVHGLRSHAQNLPPEAIQSALSYYDPSHKHILLHTGRKSVLRITEDEIGTCIDGAYKIIFPWTTAAQEFVPTYRQVVDWGEELFGNGTRGYGTSVENLLNLTPPQAMAVLKVWLLFVLLRNAANTRPIIAAFGQPGCLGKDTPLEIRRGEHSSQSTTIQVAYKKLHGLTAIGRPWELGQTLRIRSLKNGTVEWRDVHDIVYSGKKTTYNVKVASCPAFTATADHRFLTPSGYKPLSALNVGAVVVVRGSNLGGKGRSAVTRRIVAANHHPYARMKTVNGYGPYGNILYCRAILEAQLNWMPIEEYLRIVHTDKEAAAKLKYLPQDVHIHHEDENPENDTLDNVRWMTKQEHDNLHAPQNKRNLGYFSGVWGTTTAAVQSITEYGVEDTYDIQMEDDDAPNFLVNGVVTHNSGKSFLFKRVYALLYGRRKSVSSVTEAEHFDTETSHEPLVILDNVDTWEKWLPDRLALSAGVSDITKRKLYSDADVVTVSRQAILGVTAHNPKFGREDVADRLLLLSFRRLERFESEQDILNDIRDKRNAIWGSIVSDLQRVLRTPLPQPQDVPQFRVEDFARFGVWIARALGCEADFKSSIGDVKSAQQSFVLEEEGLLVGALMKFISGKPERAEQHFTASQLWGALERICDDPRSFNNAYRNSVALSKKLSAMQSALSTQINIAQTTNGTGARVWTLSERN